VSSPIRAALPGSEGKPTNPLPLTLPIVCLITDRSLAPNGLVEAVAAAVRGGVTMVQLREKDLPTRELLDLAGRLREVVEPPAMLLVNGRADVAYAAAADGVHLPSDGLPTGSARAALGASTLIGRSVHNAGEARSAARDALDYVELGTIFASRSHLGGATVGIAEIEAARSCGRPILAVGGIDESNAAAVMETGASGVAVISAILAAPSPEDAAKRLAAATLQAWAKRAIAARAV